jgi:hypothetical protein
VKIWSGWDNTIGSFQGKMWRDGWNGWVAPDSCECCNITSDTITYSGGSWTATMQFGGGATTVNVLSESNTFTEFGTVTGVKYLCSSISAGAAPTCPSCGICCGGTSGLYDVVVVTFSGQNKSAPYYDTQAQNEDGQYVCDPPYDPAYERNYYYQYNATVYYAKAVPFTATRTLTGVYTRYAALVTVPQNFYRTSTSGPAESLSYTGCTAVIGADPPNQSECLCGTANGHGFTFPATITLT